MRILILNQDWFADEFRALGHEVMTAGLAFAEHLEHKINLPFLHIDTLIEQLPGGFVPDRIVVHDNSSPIAFSGLDETEIPILFYSVDTHHHAALHRYLYELFDYTCIAQKDYLPFFQEWKQTPEWFPLWASRYVEVSEKKEHGAVFVGTLNAELNPDRVKFFDALREQVPILCTTGEYWKIFPFSEVVINQTVKGDLNFRVFESMMCGTMLLTERSGNGLFDIFTDGEHLVTYEKGNVEEAARKIEYFLAHPQEARAIALKGRSEVLANHTPLSRAKRMIEILEKLEKKTSPIKFYSMMVNHTCIARSGKSVDVGARLMALTCALKSAEYGLKYNEIMDNALACHLVIATHDYDKYTQSIKGYELLCQTLSAHPHEQVLIFAAIREALNHGRVAQAKELVHSLGVEDSKATFDNAERIIRSLLETA